MTEAATLYTHYTPLLAQASSLSATLLLMQELTRKLLTLHCSIDNTYQQLVVQYISSLAANTPSHPTVAVYGYRSEPFGTWDPHSVIQGLPGSEECTVYATEELARRGYQVTVYMDPPVDSMWTSPFANPRWLPTDVWHSSATYKYDLALLWRIWAPEVGRKRANKVFYWPHDSPPVSAVFPRFDGLCFLSKHQQDQYYRACPNSAQMPSIICGNGLVPSQFSNPAVITNPHSVGYFSNYSRGLLDLLAIWPEVKKEYPCAILAICYGRETWGTMSAEALAFAVKQIESDSSIKEYGKIGHAELAHVMQSTSVWAYPCNTDSETFCITAVKCQAAGCIPVTTRRGALAETVLSTAPSIPAINNLSDLAAYSALLRKTLAEAGVDRASRQQYIDFGLSFSWEKCVDAWLELYRRVQSA